MGPGPGDLGQEVPGGEVAVGQHDHPGAQAAQQPRGVGRLPEAGRPEHDVDQRPGTARHQCQQPQLGVPGTAVGAGLLGVPGADCVAVGDRNDGPVDRAHQQPAPPHPALARPGQWAPEQVEEPLHRRRPDPPPGLGHRAGRRHRARVSAGGQFAPHTAVADLGEQAAGQQQVDHHPRGQVP